MSKHEAEMILKQLGGNRFVAMTGAKNFVSDGASLSFSLPRGASNKANKVRVTLTTDDTYTVEFFNIRGVNFKQVSSHVGIYASNLQNLFTAETGLDTHKLKGFHKH